MTGDRAATDRSPSPRPRAARRPADLVDFRFRALVDPEAWARLPPRVQARFSKRLDGGATALYAGHIEEARMTRLGWLLAQACRLIGAPLPLGRAAGVAVSVAVTEDRAAGGQVWTRIYGRRRGCPQVIHSAKRFRGPTGLEEYLGRGIGMALTVSAVETGLVFRSDHYFLEAAGRRVRLPAVLSPGVATISHIDRGGGAFDFALELRHPVFGCLLRQTGRFHDFAPAP